ncbi:MAG TPA: hypothetical protein VIN67_03595, partial [Desulfobaccales bacterium]
DYDLWLRLTWRYAVGLVPEPLIIKRGGRPDQLSAQWGLDRYRIRALTKLLEEPELPPPYAQAARRVLARKCAIYAQGCEKRHRGGEAGFYRELGRRAEGNEAWKPTGLVFNAPGMRMADTTSHSFGGTGFPACAAQAKACGYQ